MRNKYNSIKSYFLSAIILLLIIICTPAVALADDTVNYPWIRPDNWLSQVIDRPSGGTGSGHITVDVELRKNNQTYNPCHNINDTYSAGCNNVGGFYKVQRYNSNSSDFPYGIFVDNKNYSTNHYWARRISTIYLEIYPYSIPISYPLDGYRLDPVACNCTVFGGLQIVVKDWKGGYSSNIGKLKIPSYGESGVSKMNGFIKRNGQSVKENEVNIDWFGQDSRTNRTSTNYPVYSFASWPTNKDGYYTSGPVLSGNYHIYVLDRGINQSGPNRKVECYGISVNGSSSRMDIELTKMHFGLDAPGRQCYDR